MSDDDANYLQTRRETKTVQYCTVVVLNDDNDFR